MHQLLIIAFYGKYCYFCAITGDLHTYVVVAHSFFVPLSLCGFALQLTCTKHPCLLVCIFIECTYVCFIEREVHSVRYNQRLWADVASRGSCILGIHYCNEGSMTATLAGPQAAQYSSSTAVWITLIKALLQPQPHRPFQE